MPNETAESTTTGHEGHEGESDPLDAKATDFYQTTDEEEQPKEKPEPKGEDGDSEDEADETDEGEKEGEDAEDAESEAAETDPDSVPRLAEDIEAVLAEHNPELIDRWNSQWKGVEKREAKLAEGEAAVKEWDNGIAALFESPENAVRDLAQFLPKLAEHHGVTIAQLVGLSDAEGSTSAEDDDLLPETAELRKETQALKAQVARLEQSANKAETERQAKEAQDRAEAEHKAYVDKVSDRTIKAIGKLHQGFVVTKAMVGEALKAYPNLKGEPIKAVETHQASALIKHVGLAVAKAAGKGSDMTRGDGARGRRLPDDPTDIKAADVYQQ